MKYWREVPTNKQVTPYENFYFKGEIEKAQTPAEDFAGFENMWISEVTFDLLKKPFKKSFERVAESDLDLIKS